MAEYGTTFWSMLLLAFGLMVLLTGVFTAYFGAGKSRKIGLGLTIFGLLALLLFTSFVWKAIPALFEFAGWDSAVVLQGIVAVLAAGLGAFLALALFLVSIMKA